MNMLDKMAKDHGPVPTFVWADLGIIALTVLFVVTLVKACVPHKTLSAVRILPKCHVQVCRVAADLAMHDCFWLVVDQQAPLREMQLAVPKNHITTRVYCDE